MFFDGSTEVKYLEDFGYFEGIKERTLKVEIGGSANTGTIFINDEPLIIEDDTFFEALREALNRLWIER